MDNSSVPTNPSSQPATPTTPAPTVPPAQPPTPAPATPAPVEPTTPAPTDGATPHKSSKLLIIVLVALVVLVIVVGVIYFMMLQSNKSAYNAKQKQNTYVVVPTKAAPTPTPVSATSNEGLSQTTQQLNQDLSALDAQTVQINTAMNEQAPNLQ